MGGCVAERRPSDRRKAQPIPGSIGELFDASGGLRVATLRAGRFWPPGSSPILSVLPGTDCNRLLPDRPKAAGAAPIEFRDRLLMPTLLIGILVLLLILWAMNAFARADPRAVLR